MPPVRVRVRVRIRVSHEASYTIIAPACMPCLMWSWGA